MININLKNINLRKEVDYILNNFGIKVLYVRNSKYARCSCYDELYKSGNIKCKKCLGSGKLTTLEVMTMFISDDKYYSKLSAAGKYNASIGKAITRHNKDIAFNDFILIVGSANNIVTDVKTVYRINNVNNVRCDNGRIEYNELDILSDDIYTRMYDDLVKRIRIDLGSNKKYVISKE